MLFISGHFGEHLPSFGGGVLLAPSAKPPFLRRAGLPSDTQPLVPWEWVCGRRVPSALPVYIFWL